MTSGVHLGPVVLVAGERAGLVPHVFGMATRPRS